MSDTISKTYVVAEEYMMSEFGLNIHQVFSYFLGRGGKAVVYVHPHYSNRVLKFTTDSATIALKKEQLRIEDSNDGNNIESKNFMFPFCFELKPIFESVWLIEEELLTEIIKEDSEWFELIKEWGFYKEISTLYSHIHSAVISQMQKERLLNALGVIQTVLECHSAKLDLCGFNLRLRDNTLVFLDPITSV